jgi:hypothetical protein
MIVVPHIQGAAHELSFVQTEKAEEKRRIETDDQGNQTDD